MAKKINYITHTIEDKKLKPCPFCGGKALLQIDVRYPKPKCEARQAYEVICPNWDCIIREADNKYFLTKKKAIDAWNTRVEVADGE